MEHRWGERFCVDAPTLLRLHSGSVVSARLANASLSGGLLRIAAPVALFSHVVVELPPGPAKRRRSQRIPAYVVRAAPEGIAVEWCEFAPAPIAALLAAHLRHTAPRPAAGSPPKTPRGVLRSRQLAARKGAL